jgi:MFS transporter, putative metabolite:H+ symporter
MATSFTTALGVISGLLLLAALSVSLIDAEPRNKGLA